MRFYFADYANDTTHLTTAQEHGAYFLLLKAMWSAGGKLPADDRRLARLALCTADEWAAIRDTILPFFKRRGGVIRHKRIDSELAKVAAKSLQASEAGKQSASKRRRNVRDLGSTSVQRPHNDSDSDSRREPKGSSSTSSASKPARPEGAGSSAPWAGPPDIWAAVVEARGAAWARQWLAPCGWQDLPEKAVVCGERAEQELRREITSLLRKCGARIVRCGDVTMGAA